MPGINTNINALNAASTLSANSVNQQTAMQQLSTGLRINSSKDDAAGLAIATKMSSQIRGITVATRNANDGISMAQTASSSLQSVTNMLQRMRELAVQSSNATLSSANRASIQVEVTQLKSEIDNISKTANFNGIKLFDGSASKVNLQTNIDAGNVVAMGIAAMGTNTLGLGSRASLSSTGFYNATAGSVSSAISSGDLIINGVTIASSIASDDNASYFDATTSPPTTDAASSAIAKAAAINKSTSLTGVQATVIGTTASGQYQGATAMVSGTDKLSVKINGVTTGVVISAGNQGTDRSNMVTAINLISNQTGVTAVDTGGVGTGIQLVAKDGRNITLANGTATAGGTLAAFGLGPAGAYTGTFALTSTTSSPITISTTNTGTLSNSGLSAGTYSANTTFVSTVFSSTNSIAAAGATSQVALNAGDLVLNGVAISAAQAADDTSSVDNSLVTSSYKNSSAISLAAAVNRSSSQSGVTATANANVIVGTGFVTNAAGLSGKKLLINNVQINLDTLTKGYGSSDVSSLINQYSGQTGVTASDIGSGVTLTAADGRNITLDSTAAAADLGIKAASLGAGGTLGSIATPSATAITTYSTISLSSSNPITVGMGTNGTNGLTGGAASNNFQKLGFVEGTYGGNANGVKISNLDLSSVAGAQTALGALDAALNQVSDQQSNLGAIQNRLQSAIDNLTSSSTNVQAAQGRIQDTDYSIATATLSKTQIIAQAATAMLAQANQQPQLVLSLLK